VFKRCGVMLSGVWCLQSLTALTEVRAEHDGQAGHGKARVVSTSPPNFLHCTLSGLTGQNLSSMMGGMATALNYLAYVQGWPEPYICTVHDRTCGIFLAKNTKNKPYIDGWFWPTLPMCNCIKVLSFLCAPTGLTDWDVSSMMGGLATPLYHVIVV
jgi:hypothetical protein